MHTIEFPGTLPDVARLVGRWYVAFAGGGQVHVHAVETEAQTTEVYAALCSEQGFCRLRAVDGVLYLLYRSGDGRTMRLVDINRGRVVREHSGRFWNWPGALGQTGYCISSMRAKGDPEDVPHGCYVFSYDGRLLSGIPPFAGTGVAYLTDTDVPVGVDASRPTVPGMYCPQFSSGTFVVGEQRDGGGILILDTATGETRTLWSPDETFVPKIVTDGPRTAIVTALTGYTRWRLAYDLSMGDFLALPRPVPPAPPEPPAPLPEPPADPLPTPPVSEPPAPPVIPEPPVPPVVPPSPVPPPASAPPAWISAVKALAPLVLSWFSRRKGSQ